MIIKKIHWTNLAKPSVFKAFTGLSYYIVPIDAVSSNEISNFCNARIIAQFKFPVVAYKFLRCQRILQLVRIFSHAPDFRFILQNPLF